MPYGMGAPFGLTPALPQHFDEHDDEDSPQARRHEAGALAAALNVQPPMA